MRKRIREAESRLGQRLPVYCLVTKNDLVVGFSEFFDDLDRDTREQVWGTTFPANSSPEGQIARFGPSFAALLDRLNERLLERLQSELGQPFSIGGPQTLAGMGDSARARLTVSYGLALED